MTTQQPQCRKTTVNPIKKSPVLSQLLETNEEFEASKQLEQDALAKTSDSRGFHMSNSEGFSNNYTRLTRKKRKKTPDYRIINKYSKSTKQYWKERNRRKQTSKLASKGFTHKEIADRLGVSTKTVQRDLKKLSRYVTGKFNNAILEIHQEHVRKVEAEIQGLNPIEQLKHVAKLLIEEQKRRRAQDYRRHLIKLIIDMDDLIGDAIPKIKHWPNREHTTYTMPLHVKLYYRIDGKNLKAGGFDLT